MYFIVALNDWNIFNLILLLRIKEKIDCSIFMTILWCWIEFYLIFFTSFAVGMRWIGTARGRTCIRWICTHPTIGCWKCHLKVRLRVLVLFVFMFLYFCISFFFSFCFILIHPFSDRDTQTIYYFHSFIFSFEFLRKLFTQMGRPQLGTRLFIFRRRHKGILCDSLPSYLLLRTTRRTNSPNISTLDLSIKSLTCYVCGCERDRTASHTNGTSLMYLKPRDYSFWGVFIFA